MKYYIYNKMNSFISYIHDYIKINSNLFELIIPDDIDINQYIQ